MLQTRRGRDSVIVRLSLQGAKQRVITRLSRIGNSQIDMIQLRHAAHKVGKLVEFKNLIFLMLITVF